MKGKVRNAVIVAAGVLILAVILTVVLYYYNDKLQRDNAWIYSAADEYSSSQNDGYSQKSDINKAKLDELMYTKGVGRKIAHDIINYREKCGGFTSMEQLKDIASVTEDVYDVLCENFTVKSSSGSGYKNESYTVARVNLNTASINELICVEGITEQTAEQIILYRKAHGDFTSVRELLNIEAVSLTLYNQISDKVTV